MIIGIFIRNFKIYGHTTFIPLSNGDEFTALIGDNGVGKSTVLQALDCFFNNKKLTQNVFMKYEDGQNSFIQPVFLIPKASVPDNLKKEAEEISDYLWKFRSLNNITNEKRAYIRHFQSLLSTVPEHISKKEFYLLTVGIDISNSPGEVIIPADINVSVNEWLAYFQNLYRYIFIPTAPDPDLIFGFAANDNNPHLKKSAGQFCTDHFGTESCDLLNASEKLELIVHMVSVLLQSMPDKLWLIGFDEPEATLQTAVCYDLYEKIYHLKDDKAQIVLTSHWYGFIPVLTSGMVVNIDFAEKRHKFLRFDISRFREDIKIRKRIYMEKYNEELPVDVSLKSLNDFIQSLLGSIINKPYYNWLICEGSSEMIYFNYYFEEEIKNNQLRIVPVGGVREVKKIYTYLTVPFMDLKEYILGNIILLTDTDTQLLEFDTHAIEHLYCFRLVNNKGKTQLVHIKSNPKSPATEIEDVLNGRVFNKALSYFKKYFPDQLDFVSDEEKPEVPSYYAMDLSPSQYQKMIGFFDANHHNKVRFANKYIEICKEGDYIIPEWILRIKDIVRNNEQPINYNP